MLTYIINTFNILVSVAFWLLVFLAFYAFAGYPLLLSLIYLLRKKTKTERFEFTPKVSLVVLAGNDKKTIAAKLDQCFTFEYPKEKIEIIVAVVLSTDNTAKMVEQYFKKGVKLLFQADNPGVARVINACVSEASGEIVIFTDGVSEIEKFSIKNLVRHFAEPKVGLVAGNTEVSGNSNQVLTDGQSFSLYHERVIMANSSKIRKISRVWPELFAIRKADYHELNDDGVPAEVAIPLMYSVSGKDCLFEPLALAMRPSFKDPEQTLKKATADIVSSFRSAVYLKELLHSKQYISLLQLFSHEMLYQNHGVLLLGLFLYNIFAISVLPLPEFVLLFSAQFLFYVTGAFKFWYVPYYINITSFAGIKAALELLNEHRRQKKEQKENNAKV